MTRHHLAFVTLVLGLLALPAGKAFGQPTEEETVKTATAVLTEVMRLPGRAIPHSLLSKAHGVAIIPNVVKGGFVVGVRHGKGVMLVRDEQGLWQPPMFVTLTGGSIGWQVGIQSTDLILVFRTKRSVNGLMNGKLTIGADAAAAAGPVGRKAAASTDATLSAEILSYSKSRGLFAGVSIDGSVMQVDRQAGFAYYQPQGAVPGLPAPAAPTTIPASAVQLINTLAQYTAAPQVAADDVVGQPESIPAPAPTPALLPAQNTLSAQLQAAQQQLLGIVEQPSWRDYLRMPEDAAGEPTSDLQQVQQTLQRYDAVAADPRYSTLTGRPEFAAMHQLLRGYLASLTQANRQGLRLPPPPGSGATPPTRR